MSDDYWDHLHALMLDHLNGKLTLPEALENAYRRGYQDCG